METGFKLFDRALDWCEAHGLYVIIDLHSVQGYQNTDWHCDNSSRRSMFWDTPHFQDRFVSLWEAFAQRYKDRGVVAGYNLMNEPHTGATRGRLPLPYQPDWNVVNRIYRRTVNAIRAIDPEHIIFLEGDFYSTHFSGLDKPFTENLVYSCHTYSPPGGTDAKYPGIIGNELWNRDRLRKELLDGEGMHFAKKYNVPLWIGEFGFWFRERDSLEEHLMALEDQINVFEEYGCHWTCWNYKDSGLMGMVELNPECELFKRLKPVLDRMIPAFDIAPKGKFDAVRKKMKELADIIETTIVNPDIQSGTHSELLVFTIMESYVNNLIQPLYVKAFEEMSESEIDLLMQSFEFKNCIAHPLADVLKKYFKLPA